MEKLSFFGALALLILVSSPIIFSYSCDGFSNEYKEACLEIAHSDLTDSEKELLISNLENENNVEPPHFLVYSKNTNLEIKDSPEGVQTYLDDFIENAWMKIFTLMPSIIYKDYLYVPQYGKLLVGFHYDFDEPQDYRSPGYPKKQNGDCKTTYRLLEKTETNKVYVDGIYQGQGQLVPITVNRDSKIESIYNVKIKYEVNHYEWDRDCCKRRYGFCVKYCYDCEYDHDRDVIGEITIRDSLNVKRYNNNLVAEITEIAQMPYSNKLDIGYSDSVEISFLNSAYSYYRYLFEIVSSIPPYNIQTIKATDYGSESISNLFKQEDSLIVGNIQDCKIRGFDFFNEIENVCSSESSYIGLRIETDKLKYSEGEEIEVKIFPADVWVNVSYAEDSYSAKGKINLNAKAPFNKVKAIYGWGSAEKIIYIQNKSRLILVYNLLWILLIFFLLFILLRKYWRRIWLSVDS